MKFKTEIFPSPKSENIKAIHLKEEGKYEAIIYSFGSILNNFFIHTSRGNIDIIDGYASVEDAVKNITNGFKSAKLNPFVCRLNNGNYQFEGIEHTISKHAINGSAIHGLLFDVIFDVLDVRSDADSASVQLNYRFAKKAEGFPFEYDTKVGYCLRENGWLEITTTVTNTGITAMPLADGWHPYFKTGGKIDNQLLQINVTEKLVFNDKLIPTGATEDFYRFSSPEKIKDTMLDNCFKINNKSSFACSLSNQQNGIYLQIIPDETYPYLQLYIPPERESIAVECLSSPPDSFNNLIGLIILQPGESRTFVTNYKIALQDKQ